MTIDQLRKRDERIAELDALGRLRTAAQTAERDRLVQARDMHWRRIAAQIERAERRAAELRSYAQHHRLSVAA